MDIWYNRDISLGIHAWLFVFHVCHRGTRFHLDFVFCAVECHQCCMSFSYSTASGHALHCWLIFLSVLNCLLFLFFPSQIQYFRSPHMWPSRYLLSYFLLWVYMCIALCTAPVCNKSWWMQPVELVLTVTYFTGLEMWCSFLNLYSRPAFLPDPNDGSLYSLGGKNKEGLTVRGNHFYHKP